MSRARKATEDRMPPGAAPVGEYNRRQAKDTPDYAGMLALQCVVAGLDNPAFEHRYALPRRLRADLAWPYRKLLVEIQGGIYTGKAHGSIGGILADNDRLNEATWNGWRLLRFTPDQVVSGEALAGAERALKGDL